MSSAFTPLASTLTRLYKGDPRLKRVAVSIINKREPETVLNGYALVSELNETLLSFFSTQKFKIDEELTLCTRVHSEELEYQLRFSHLLEQISSGRVMTMLPSEEHPFPARKFYRCYAKVLSLKRDGKPVHSEEPGQLATVSNITSESAGELKAA